jgi:hypothetical protein
MLVGSCWSGVLDHWQVLQLQVVYLCTPVIGSVGSTLHLGLFLPAGQLRLCLPPEWRPPGVNQLPDCPLPAVPAEEQPLTGARKHGSFSA